MSEHAPRVMIVAGEASGDMYGANLAIRLRDSLSQVEIVGVGGRRMREAGVRILYDSSAWSAIGIAESLKLVPRLLVALHGLRTSIKANPPDLLLPIDFGAFNTRLIKDIPRSAKVLYFIPPGSWRRDAQYDRMKGLVDRAVTPFPWSAEAMNREGIKSDFFGHPLLDIVKPALTEDAFRREVGFSRNAQIVGLLPGSRAQELTYNLPALLSSALKLAQSIDSVEFAIPLTSSVDPMTMLHEMSSLDWIDAQVFGVDKSNRVPHRPGIGLRGRTQELLKAGGIDSRGVRVKVRILQGQTYDVFAHARCAIVSSGTATLEAAILGCPAVIIYRGSRISAREYRLLGKYIKFIGLPNILLDRYVCPELIQDSATPSEIASIAAELLGDTDRRQAMLSDFSEVRNTLGAPGALSRTADVIVSILKEDRCQSAM